MLIGYARVSTDDQNLALQEDALKELKSASNPDDIQDLSIRYLGRKGIITQFLRGISKLPLEDRPEAGKRANETKKALDDAFKSALTRLESSP